MKRLLFLLSLMITIHGCKNSTSEKTPLKESKTEKQIEKTKENSLTQKDVEIFLTTVATNYKSVSYLQNRTDFNIENFRIINFGDLLIIDKYTRMINIKASFSRTSGKYSGNSSEEMNTEYEFTFKQNASGKWNVSEIRKTRGISFGKFWSRYVSKQNLKVE